jgi:hypothetical protein
MTEDPTTPGPNSVMASLAWEEIEEKIYWTWEEILAGHESLPWKQTQGEKGGQR